MAARDGLTVVAGHMNPDFDAYGSMVAATKLFPGAIALYGGTQNANVREFHLLHGEFLAFVDMKGFDRSGVSRLVMVDTRDAARLGEVGSLASDEGVEVVMYDHHPRTACDLARGEDRSRAVGATTSILVHEIREREIGITPLEASAMLLGIHEDTGSLTYPGTTAYDADAVAFLMAQGADMEVVERFLSLTLTTQQRALLEQLTASLEVWKVHGRDVAVATATIDGYVDSAGLVTHHLVEDLGHRVAIAVIATPERIQLVGRSRQREADMGAVLAHLGGGGHAQAASAALRDATLHEALALLRHALEVEVLAPLSAGAIASAPVRTVEPTETMNGAGELMARWGHRSLPVEEDGRLSGIVTRRDVDKAVRHGLGHAPVTGFMTRSVPVLPPEAGLEALERLMSTEAVASVPVVADGRLVGIVTRADLLRAEHGDAYLSAGEPLVRVEAERELRAVFDEMLPTTVRQALRDVGGLAQDAGVRAFLVGGFVRDLLLHRPNLDVDIVVEGDGIAFAEKVAAQVGGHVRPHARFGTAVVVLPGGSHVDVTSARTEYYTRPGALPTVERSSMRQDLLRRDFSINAIAVAIDPAEFGRIADPFGGLSDLRAGVLRVLHPLSFVEDATRVLRAARFEIRFGFRMDAETEELAHRAVGLGLLTDLSGARVREELLSILDEPGAVAVLRRLDELGALDVLLPQGVTPAAALSDADAVEKALQLMPRRAGRAPHRTVVLLQAMAGRAEAPAVAHWVERLRLGRESSAAVVEAATRVSTVCEMLVRSGKPTNSQLDELLGALLPETLVYTRARCSEAARERIDHYARDLSGVRLEVSGDDLVAMGAAPSPAFSAILARIRARRLDGAVQGREAELAELRHLAVRAGLIA